ncbi:MAG: hypothetical protein ACRC33_06445 [Gemmataceae bacterium]
MVRIENYSANEWAGVTVGSLPPHMRLSRFERLPNGNGMPRQVWLAELTLDASGLPTGTVRDAVIVTADDKKQLATISMLSHVVDDVTLLPTVINLGPARLGDVVRAKMFLQIRGSVQIAVLFRNCSAEVPDTDRGRDLLRVRAEGRQVRQRPIGEGRGTGS